MDDHVKIYFEIPSDKSEEIEIETVWASRFKGGFMIDNIPFYAKGISFEDIVSVKEINDCLYMDKLLKPSGHSTVRIWFANEESVQAVREGLKSMGCTSEISDQPRLVAVDVPPSVSYEEIRGFLEEGERNGKWDYQEACLGFL